MVDKLPKIGKVVKIEADSAELEALRNRFSLLSFAFLRASVTISPSFGRASFVANGNFEAAYTQECGVTLTPIPQTSTGEFKRLYKVGDTPYDERELVVDLDEADPPDLIPTGKIDLGDLVAEEFGLTLDQFPRADGAEFEEVRVDEDGSETSKSDNPFAALEKLRDKWRK